jgi:hypothetical protein
MPSSKPLQFLHITKCAGTSVENWGKKMGFRWGRFFSKGWGKEVEFKPPHRGLLKSDVFHAPPAFFVSSPYAGCELFTIVRDPYTRAISEFRCPWHGFCSPVKKNKKGHEKRAGATPEDLNAWLMKKASAGCMAPPFRNGHLIPQVLYVFDESLRERRIAEQNVIRFENLSRDFSILSRRHGFDDSHVLEHSNTSDMPSFSVQDIFPETRAMLASIYADDFDMLSYEK